MEVSHREINFSAASRRALDSSLIKSVMLDNRLSKLEKIKSMSSRTSLGVLRLFTICCAVARTRSSTAVPRPVDIVIFGVRI